MILRMIRLLLLGGAITLVGCAADYVLLSDGRCRGLTSDQANMAVEEAFAAAPSEASTEAIVTDTLEFECWKINNPLGDSAIVRACVQSCMQDAAAKL